MPAVNPYASDNLVQQQQRLLSKRKLDDFGASGDDPSDLVSVRMRKDIYAVNSSLPSADQSLRPISGARVSAARSTFCPGGSGVAGSSRSASSLQFFVRMISEGHTLVMRANYDDTVKSVHESIQVITRIPVIEQRLIYRGKQLEWEQTLSKCHIGNDSSLQLVGRMRSTEHPQAWQAIDDIVSSIWWRCRGEDKIFKDSMPDSSIKSRLLDFLNMTPRNDIQSAAGHLQIILSSSTPAALVMLYLSSKPGNRNCADDAIRDFINSYTMLPRPIHSQCVPIVLELCKLLGSTTYCRDRLYLLCRSSLASLVETVGISPSGSGSACGSNSNLIHSDKEGSILFKDILPFATELVHTLSKDLDSSMASSTHPGPFSRDVRDLSVFLSPLRTAILEQVDYQGLISMPLPRSAFGLFYFREEIEFLYFIFCELLDKMVKCLHKVEECFTGTKTGGDKSLPPGWSVYLNILKELYGISKLYNGAEEQLWNILKLRKLSLCGLIMRYAERSDDNRWILENKDVTDFESRRHLVMMLLPEVKDDYEELHEMLIDRSQLLAESFEYIGRAEPESLHGGIFMEFKNEEATGPGVLREWFCLVCQEIFNPQNALFAACPNDRRRFYPNPASKVDPMHLDYFIFSGRVVALALMHKVQVGIVFDRLFFVQLASRFVLHLDDIQDADPELYRSCKEILEMDAEFLDSDELGLTFITEVDELGSRKVTELLPGGKNIIVNSQNRKQYVDLLIQHRFVTSISKQVNHFSQGFADIMCNSSHQSCFFQSLDLKDLDLMLHGSESDVSIEDWKAHTEYNGYTKNDPQISWFWEIVAEMSADQKKILLFFWTSVKYLPVDGFSGLSSRLYIYKSSEPHDRLPSSHTCFYRLCFPPYPSMVVMQDRLRVITQEHVGCSFGTW